MKACKSAAPALSHDSQRNLWIRCVPLPHLGPRHLLRPSVRKGGQRHVLPPCTERPPARHLRARGENSQEAVQLAAAAEEPSALHATLQRHALIPAQAPARPPGTGDRKPKRRASLAAEGDGVDPKRAAGQGAIRQPGRRYAPPVLICPKNEVNQRNGLH